MKIITTTNARKNIKAMVDKVRYEGEIFAIGRRNSIDAILIQFPQVYNKEVDDITNVNAYSTSFDFLTSEPELYAVSDMKKKYA